MQAREALAMLNGFKEAASFFAMDVDRLQRRLIGAIEIGAIDAETELTGVSFVSPPGFTMERPSLQRISDILP